MIESLFDAHDVRPQGVPEGWPTVLALTEKVRRRHGWKAGHDELTLARYAEQLALEVGRLRRESETADDMRAALAEVEAERNERNEWIRASDFSIRAAEERAEKAEATVKRQGEALREIDDTYACYGSSWNAYVGVKRIARAALAGSDVPPATCACGAGLVACEGCGDERCPACDPYDDDDRCEADPPRLDRIRSVIESSRNGVAQYEWAQPALDDLGALESAFTP